MSTDEIVKALMKCCVETCDGCAFRPEDFPKCEQRMHKSAAKLIESLQAQVACVTTERDGIADILNFVDSFVKERNSINSNWGCRPSEPIWKRKISLAKGDEDSLIMAQFEEAQIRFYKLCGPHKA